MPNYNGQDTIFSVRMNSTLTQALDAYAAQHNISRGEAIRRAVVALTGALPVQRKRRSDAFTEIPCPVHYLNFAICYSHDKTCDSIDCECLYHR